MNEKNYIVIMGWMIKHLNLKGNELLVYAIIYSFCQAENQAFNGSLQYLADWTNSTRQGVLKNLQSLEEKELIFKRDVYFNGYKFCEYSINKAQVVTNTTSEEKPKETKIETTTTKKFQKPTIAEIINYCKEIKATIDAEKFYNYYESNGWKVGKNAMKDWKAAVRTWQRNNRYSVPTTSSKYNYGEEI